MKNLSVWEKYDWLTENFGDLQCASDGNRVIYYFFPYVTVVPRLPPPAENLELFTKLLDAQFNQQPIHSHVTGDGTIESDGNPSLEVFEAAINDLFEQIAHHGEDNVLRTFYPNSKCSLLSLEVDPEDLQIYATNGSTVGRELRVLCDRPPCLNPFE